MFLDVLIVGAGLAGLCCATARSSKPACGSWYWRLRTALAAGSVQDRVEGFRLDRGFQVFLTAYPEAKRLLDYQALDLRVFHPGALVRHGGAFHRLTDPWRRPLQGLLSLFSPIGSLLEQRGGPPALRVLKDTLEDRFKEPETTTLQALQEVRRSSRERHAGGPRRPECPDGCRSSGALPSLFLESLSRSARESVITMAMLKELVHLCKVRVISVTEGIDSVIDSWGDPGHHLQPPSTSSSSNT